MRISVNISNVYIYLHNFNPSMRFNRLSNGCSYYKGSLLIKNSSKLIAFVTYKEATDKIAV